MSGFRPGLLPTLLVLAMLPVLVWLGFWQLERGEHKRELLERHTVIFLDISPEEGARRTSGDSNRPVLAAADPLEHYRNLVDTRRPFYQEVADYRVRTDARTPQQVVGDILGFLDTL